MPEAPDASDGLLQQASRPAGPSGERAAHRAAYFAHLRAPCSEAMVREVLIALHGLPRYRRLHTLRQLRRAPLEELLEPEELPVVRLDEWQVTADTVTVELHVVIAPMAAYGGVYTFRRTPTGLVYDPEADGESWIS